MGGGGGGGRGGKGPWPHLEFERGGGNIYFGPT